MLKIVTENLTELEHRLKLEGWISDGEAAHLHREGERLLDLGHSLILELSGVRFIDEAGAQVLQDWQQRGVRLQLDNPFISTLLQAYGLHIDE